MPPRKALVIGAGIAGPAAALFLKRAGIDAIVHEAAPAPDDHQGLFLNLATNGVHVLHALGLEAALDAGSSSCRGMVMHNDEGRALATITNGAPEGRGPASRVILRGTLQRILREAAMDAGIPLRSGKRLLRIEDDGYTVTAHFEDGTMEQGDLLIGCDGLRSRTRRLLLPHAPGPRYTGLLSVGGRTHDPSIAPTPDRMHMFFGKRAFFGYTARTDGDILWFSNIVRAEEPARGELDAWSPLDRRDQLLDQHADDPDTVRRIIASTRSPIGAYPIHDLPPLDTWHRGLGCVIGDAAHATSPHAGQGAAMALEDAMLLARTLRGASQIPEAFVRFQDLRRERVRKIVAFAARTGKSKLPSTPLGRGLRDLFLPMALKVFASPSAMAWVDQYRIDWHEDLAA